MTTASRNVPGIQTLRGLAAIAVVIHHALGENAGHILYVPLGAAGVDVFFVISGFIMVHTSEGLTAGKFLLRRFLRIAPLYWLFLLFLIGGHASGVIFRNLNVTPEWAAKSFLFIAGKRPLHVVGWTLNFEMYFYVLFAGVIAMGAFRWSAVLIPVLLGLVMLAAPHSFYADPIVFEFAFGAALAVAYRAGLLSDRFAVPALAVAACALVASSLLAPGAIAAGAPTARWLFWGIPAAAMVYGSLWWRPRMTLLGDASYSIYLAHPLVMTVYARVLFLPIPAWLSGIGAVLASIALGLGVYHFVERPLHRWISARLRGGKREIRLGGEVPSATL